ncbi:MAG TPA: mucoidy inhibitor MuiA family protein [Patescibacteria group bacterium]|nr:mucoidy inhibitor MuiA family protein [Patescibacteria group bacterium]
MSDGHIAAPDELMPDSHPVGVVHMPTDEIVHQKMAATQDAFTPLPNDSSDPVVNATAASNDIVAKSTIKAVTVYADRAKVTREAIVEVPAGAHTVVFHGLPAILVPDSIRAEGSAIAAVKFGAVTQKVVTSTDLVAPREKELSDQLESLGDQRIVLEKAKEALDKKKDFIESLGQQAHLRTDENIAQIDLKPDQWSAAAQTIYSNVSDILAAETQQDIKIRAVDKQIEKVRQDMSGLRTDQKSTYDVIVPLEAESSTKLTIDLSYQVPDATWRPLYDARLETKDEKLALTEYGAVRQKTGEDWKDAALTLSTAQPERGASQPDLNPLWVDAYQQQNFGRYYAPEMREAPGRENVSQNYAKAIEEVNRANVEKAIRFGGSSLPIPVSTPTGRLNVAEPKEATFVTAQIETGGFTSEYKITGPATVMSDNTESKLMVGAFDTDSKIQIQIKPQLGSEAYLVAKTKLKGDSPILPGQANLFRDGAFVGQDHLPLLRPGEEHGMYFGIDDQVAVKRKVLKDEKSEAGIIAKDNVLERDFITELQNLHSKPVEVVVKETSPVGRTDRITVDIVGDATTPGYKTDIDNVKGQLEWTIPMAAKEKKELKLGWKVSWPKDMGLSGL